MNDEMKKFMQFVFQDFFENVNDPSNLFHKMVLSAIIVFVWIGLLKIGKKVTSSFIENIKYSTVTYKVFRNTISTISILLLLGTWLKVKNSIFLIAILIIMLAAFSIKNLSTNLVGWFMLLRKKYFKLYDRIEINDIKGDVIKITPFYFKMIERGNSLTSSTATGRVIHMPNHILLTNPLYNYSELIQFNWGEVKYYITVDSDWKKVLHIVKKEVNIYLADFLSQYAEEEIHNIERISALFDEELKVKTYVLIEDEAIIIIAQFPIHYTKNSSTKSSLNERIIPMLNNAPNVELSGKTVHLNVDNFDELK